MKKLSFLKCRPCFLTGIILFTAVVGLLGACDDPVEAPAGCDAGEGNGPTVIDQRPLIPDPSWDCGMPDGIPSPESGEFLFEIDMTIGKIHDIGQTQYGRRHLIEVTGGTISGNDISAEVLSGGLDYQLTLPNGAMEIDQVNVIRTSDGSHIYFRNCGASADQRDVRIVPDFEAPNSSPYSFLNTGKFAGTRELDMINKTMKIKVYDVSMVDIDTRQTGAIKVTQPQNLPDQSWECRQVGPFETQGAELLTETVTLAPTIEVGESKNGTRMIAPITGGSVAGRVAGRVRFGGADYQLFEGSTLNINGIYLDARYTIETNDGELIIIRNCGPLLSLGPTFETRADGKYSYLNEQKWLSSFPTPNADQTAVTLTIYRSR